MKPNVKVELPGHGVFWLIKPYLSGSFGKALAPLEHCDENGEIKDDATAFFGQSYAHLGSDGLIRRFHEVIGKEADLIVLQDA